MYKSKLEQQLFEAIVGPVLYGEWSPYGLMTKRVNGIDVDYFQQGATLGSRLDEAFGPELKRRIFADFSAYGREVYGRADDIEREITDNVKTIMGEADGLSDAAMALEAACGKVVAFASEQLGFVPIPMYGTAELRTLYEKARRVTLKERIMGGNDRDVMEYYHALIVHTTWVCRMLTRRYAARFLRKVAGTLKDAFVVAEASPCKAYAPQPADTTAVALPDGLQPLLEAMAENVHDVWAAGRLAAGWTYGPVRDDVGRRHPCLVPYAELPEAERDYDRNTALATLRFILACGYTVTKAE